MKRFAFIGRRLPKLDAPDKATGRSTYIQDMKLPGMLYGKILRTKIPNGKIIRVDTSRAKRLTGVKAVITANDTPMIPFGYGRENLPLKKSRVRCIRDEIAAVAAVDESIAEEALELIQVDYEEMLGIYDVEQAGKPGAPVVHEGYKNNLFTTFQFENGDVEKAFQESDVVIEDTFKLPLTNACPMGTSAIIAHYDASGRLNIWTPTQVPFLWLRDLAEALGMSENRIRVLQPTIGGGFGVRLDIYPFEPICALLSIRTGKPVKIEYDREEEFLAAPNRQPCIVRMRSGARKDGILTARDASYLLDCGAYVSWGALTPNLMCQTTSSLYRVPNVRFNAKVMYTNNPYSGAMRGWGNPQSTFVVESNMDMLAAELNMDPLELRLKNVNRPNELTPQGFRVTSCGLEECLRKAGERSDWKRKKRKVRGRGIGVASAMGVAGGAKIYRSDGCGSIVKIDDFGKVTLVTGSTEIGQGSDIMLAQIVAEEIGVPLEDVRVVNSDTDIKPWDTGTHASRTTFVAGNSAKLAAEKAKEKIKSIAAEKLGVRPEDIETAGGNTFLKNAPESKMSIAKVVRSSHFREGGNLIIAEHFYDPPNEMLDRTLRGNWSAAYSYCTHVAEVEVDLDTGKVKLLKMVYAHDVGRAINPMMVEGQMDGATYWGVGYALMEELRIERGVIQNTDMHEYLTPTVADIPDIDKIIVETIDPQGPFGAKGMGDFGVSSVPPAIANAIYDAVGVRLKELPMNPEKILIALRSKGQAS